ncbi:MAG TPA: hypothetical protein EYQ82_08130, partial [Dehalococcoidia bacterium]|nr:hypothetical protein [Dehalococcoidia bacterium]
MGAADIDLLAVHYVVVTVLNRLGLRSSQVGTSLWPCEQLPCNDLAREDRRQHPGLLLACAALKRELHDVLGDDSVLIAPTHPRAAPRHNRPLLRPMDFVYTGIFNVLEVPATACPMGLGAERLPVGVQVIGPCG